MGEITPDVEALHMIIGLGNLEATGSAGGNTYDLAQRTSDLAQRIMSSDWLEAHDREIAEKAFRAGWNASGEGWNGEYPDEGALWEVSAGKQEYEKWADTEGATE